MQMLEPLEPRQLLSAGDIDPTFGTNGLVDVEDLIISYDNSAIVPAGATVLRPALAASSASMQLAPRMFVRRADGVTSGRALG
jgi:hypothetical protein